MLALPTTRPAIRDMVSNTIPTVGDPNIKVLLNALVSNSFLTTGSGGVFEWQDQSGNLTPATQVLISAQGTVGTSFGRPGLRIDANDQFMNIGFKHDWNNEEFTIIAVASKLASTGVRGLISNRSEANWWTMGMTGANNTVIERTGGFVNLDYNFDMQGQPIQILEFAHNPGVNERIFRNGVLADTEAASINIGSITSDLTIGKWAGLAPNKWEGFIHYIEVRIDLFNAETRAAKVAELSADWQ